jgi:hypothetical protein
MCSFTPFFMMRRREQILAGCHCGVPTVDNNYCFTNMANTRIKPYETETSIPVDGNTNEWCG